MTTKLHCRACGDYVTTCEEAKVAVQKEYTYTDEEIDDPSFVLHVWHPVCAVGDGRIDSVDDLDGAPFAYQAYSQKPRDPTLLKHN